MSVNNILPFITFIIPAMGMLAGLSASVSVAVFFLLFLANFYKKADLKYFQPISIHYKFKDYITKFVTKNYKVECLFVSWSIFSGVWSINIFASLWLSISTFSIILISFILQDNISVVDDNVGLQKKIKVFLIAGIVAAIILFFIEKNSHGILSRSFRQLFQSNTKEYFLYMLDRGCALLSVTSWIVIGILIKNKQYWYALVLYIVVFYLLSISDGLASFLGFICGGFVFILGALFAERFYKLLRISILIGAVSLPFIVYNISPRDLSDKYTNFIADSAKHRLFIWNFVANKILEKPIIGFGIGAAKFISIDEDEMIDYHQYHWSPLPLHPHNNILQILLDLGLVGFLLLLITINKWLKKISNSMSNNKYFCIVGYACFVNYLIIGMISYSVWQLWWVYIGAWVAFMMQYILKNH